MIRWGIISTGLIAHEFARDFPYVKKGVLSGVASRDITKARDFSTEFDIPKSYGSYQALIDDPEIDAIYIGTPHNYHFDAAKAALEAGKAVLCEKPITHDLELSKQLITIARQKRVYLMEAMWTYFIPTIKTAKQWLDGGRIGNLKTIKADFGFNMQHLGPKHRVFNPELAGGSMLDIGIYPIAFTTLFMDEKPQEIHKLIRYASTGVDEDVSMLFKYKEVDAHLHCSLRSQLSNYGLLIGDSGTIRLTDFWESHCCELFQDGDLVDTFTIPELPKGWAYEVDAVNEDLLAGKLESDTVPHSRSILWQEIIADVLGG